jgi:hypothetical protein
MSCDPVKGCPPDTHNLHCGYPNCEKGRKDRSVEPIRPEEVGNAKLTAFPNEVIQAFNTLIARNFYNGSAEVKQKDVQDKIMELFGDTTARNPVSRMQERRKQMQAQGWMNIEALYESYGWKVSYTKPDYSESFPSYFTFSKK